MKIVKQHKWLLTGCAGFIGSNILEFLLRNKQIVTGLDNFLTGFQRNLDEVKTAVSDLDWQNFRFIQGDIRDISLCRDLTENVDIVIHQAAIGSVPRSINDPIMSHDINVTGFLNILHASCENRVRRFIYASSSSVYGDNMNMPKIENNIGNQLSPYAVTKYTNELYAGVFSKTYNIEVVGLRYFNVFGRRQDPSGQYAAVIPLWFKSILNDIPPVINGDGDTSRDFCYIDNVVNMNILCALTKNTHALNRVYNVACSEQTSLNQLFEYIKQTVGASADLRPLYRDFRAGDIRHSLADISSANKLVGYEPSIKIQAGLKIAHTWYRDFFKGNTYA